ncbi:Phosphatidylinositol phosphatase PTPRQ-like isoform X2, partial [Oopsacas minuta]
MIFNFLKLTRISITLIVLLASCIFNHSQDLAFTPNQYYFAISEDSINTIGPVYVTTNTSPVSSNPNFQVAIPGPVYLQVNILDYENVDQRRDTTVITDTSSLEAAEINICLIDLNDNIPTPPSPDSLTIEINTTELSVNNTIVRFNSTDADSNANGLVMFKIDSNSTNAANFSLTSAGVLENTDPLPLGDYSVGIEAYDGGSTSLTSTTTFVLTITENSSNILEQDRYVFTIDENSAVDTLIGTITVSGTTIDLSPTPTAIRIDNSTGELYLNSSLDYETTTELSFSIVTTSDPLTTLGTLIIYINNIEDTAPTLSQSTYNIDLPVDTPANNTVWCVPALSDGEEDAVVTYSVSSTDDLFAVDIDGIITITTSILNQTLNTTLTVTLTLTDGTLTSDVTLEFLLIATNPPLPGVPQNLSSVIDSGSVYNFTWTQSAGIYPIEVFPQGLEYQLTYRTLRNLINIQTLTNYSTFQQLTLSTDDVFIIRVSASIFESNFGPRAVDTIAIGDEDLVANTINSTAIRVSFRALEYCGADVTIRYEFVYRGVELDTTVRTLNINITEQTGLCTPQDVDITGLQEYVNYTISLMVTIPELGVSDSMIAEVRNETLEAVPAAPLNLMKANIDSTSFCVTFDPPASITQNGPISDYSVTYQGELFNMTVVNITVDVNTTYPLTESSIVCISNLEEYNNYTVLISANNGAGEGAAAMITVMTSEAIPNEAPQNIAGINITPTSINVCFDPPPGINQNGIITSFTITSFGSPYQTESITNEMVISPPSYPLESNVCFNLTNLEEYNNYNITVFAINSQGPGPISQSIVVMTNEAAPVVAPQNVTSSPISATSINVCFDFPAGNTQNGLITSFNVTLVGSPFDIVPRTDNILTTSFDYPMTGSICSNITGLEEYNNYTITVVLINSAGSSPVSDSTQSETLQAVSVAPLNLMEGNINSTSFCVTFDPPTSITQNGPISDYTVTYQGELFNMTVVNRTVDVDTTYPLTESSSVCIYNLEEYNNYTVLIRANNGAGEGAAAMITVMTEAAAPVVAPQNVSSSPIDATTITVCFDFTTGNTQNGLITSFDITLIGSPFDTDPRTGNILTTSSDYPMTGSICSNITGLEEYNNYTITVVLINSAGSSPVSNFIVIETLEAAPAAAPNVTLRTISSQVIEVTVCPPTPIDQNGLITNYAVSYTGDPFDTSTQMEVLIYSFSYASMICTVSNLTGLEEYNNYTVSAMAVNSAGSSDSSTPVTARTLQAVPAAPLNLMEVNINSTSFCVTFDPPTSITQNGPISNYTVTYQGELFNAAEVNITVDVNTPYPLTESSIVCIYNLEEFDNYTVLIRANNGAGEGTATMITVRTAAAVPDEPPQNVTAVALNSTAIQVCFSPPPAVNQNGPITSFTIIYSGNPFEISPQNVSITVSPVVYPLTGMLCENLTTLQEFNNYTITVIAVNMIGDGEESDDVFARTNEAAPSAPPQNFTAQSGRAILLSWIGPPAIDQNGILVNFFIEYSGIERDTDLRNITVPPTNLSINVTGLDEDTSYIFILRASTSVGDGPFTDPLRATTQAAAPSSPPVNISITVINSTALNSTWRIPDIDEHNGALESVEIRLQGIDIETSQIITVPITNTNDTTFKFTILSPLEEFVNYSVSFAVRNLVGLSPFSDPVYLRTDPAAPSDTAQNVMTVALSANSVGVMFYPPPEIDQNGPITMYNIRYIGEIFDTSNQFDNISFSDPISYPATAPISVNLTGLQEYTNYSISVRAINDEGMSEFSLGVVQLTNIAAPSETPQNVMTETLSATSIRVTFNPPPVIDQNGPDLMYNIRYTGEIFDTDPQFVMVNAPNSNYPADTQISVNLNGLQEYTNYTISVRAINVEGTTEYTNGIVQLTDIAAPSETPQNVMTETLSANSIRVTFNPPPAIDQNGPDLMYNISYTGEMFDTEPQFVMVNAPNSNYPAVTQISVNLTGLQEYNNYTISVRAINVAGTSEYTDEVVQLADIAAPSETPQNVMTVTLSATSIRVTFNPPPAIDQNGPDLMYNISYTGEIFDTNTQFVMVNAPNSNYPAETQISVDLTGLQEYNNYTIGVRAINVAGTSEYTDGVVQLTNEAVSAAPNILTVSSNNPTQICVRFTNPPAIDQNGLIDRYFVNLSSIQISGPSNRTCNINDASCYSVQSTIIMVCFDNVDEGTMYVVSVRVGNGAGLGASSETRYIMTEAVSPPTVPVFTPDDVMIQTTSTSITLIIPFVPVSVLNSPATQYICIYQGFLFEDSVFPTDMRRRRQSDRVIINMTPELFMTFPIDDNSITLDDLLPNYEYEVNVSIQTALGRTPFVTIIPPTLAANAPTGPPIVITVIPITAPIGTLQMSLLVSFENDFTTLNGALQSFNIFYQIPGDTEQQIQYFADGNSGPYEQIISNLLPNTEYSISINVVTQQGISIRSQPIFNTTYPLVPSEVPVEPTPTQSTQPALYTVEIFVPTQSLFVTANIGVIYIITDYNNPEIFTGYTTTERFSAINTNTTDTNGFIYGSGDKSTRVRIQAALGSSLFNQPGDYFSFIIGSREETTYNGITYTNLPLNPGTTVSYSYYILFLDEDMQTSADFSLLSLPVAEITSAIFPTIILPSENITLDVEFNITFEHILICESKGKLSLTTIYWTNSKFENISSHILTVTNQLLSDDRIFYCIAENTAGRDVRSVRFNLSITVMDIDDVATQLMNQTEITNDQSQVASAAVALLSGAAEDEEQLEQVASTYALLVNKSLSNGMSLDEETVISLLEAAEGIIDRSLEVNSSSNNTTMIDPEGMSNSVASINTPELIAINSIQNISQNILRDLDSGIQVIESRTVTIVVQARSVTESQSSYVFPGIVNSSTEFNTQFSIPQSVAQQLAVDGNIAVATTLINRDSNQPVDPGEGMSSQASDILIIETLQEESNVYGRIELSEDAEIAFYTKFTANLESICVALNGSIWNSDGIQTTSVPDENLTICSTSHFTSFAVFVTPHDIPTSETEELVISIFSYLLVSISFIFLLISLILFFIAGKPFFKVEANIIYFNYCLSMLLATGLFLLGIESGTHNDFVCLIIGFLLHYIWLAVFTWTLCNGIFIIFKLVIAVMTTRKIYPYLIVFGWTFPLVIPIITIAVTRENYVDPSEHCFLNINYGVIWAFISPIIILLLINLILLILAVVRIVTARAKAGEDQRLGLIKNVLIYSLILTPILGLPWVILIFNIFIRSTVVEWIFILLNGGMGLIFFIVVTLGNAEVRAIFKRKRNTQTTSNTISSRVKSGTLKYKIKKKSRSGDSEMQKNTLYHGSEINLIENETMESFPIAQDNAENEKSLVVTGSE